MSNDGLSTVSNSQDTVATGVISRGAQGAESPLLELLFILGSSAPLKILALALLFKVYLPCF